MTAHARLVPAFCVLLLLAGCGPPAMVRPEEGIQTVADTYRVEPVVAWSRQQAHGLEVWTVDGPLLQQLRFYAPRQTGDPLLVGQNVPARQRERWPRYHDGMTPHDVMELVTASLAQQGAIDVNAFELRPATFGGRSGFRFDLHFLAPTSLDYRGVATGHMDTEHGLYLVLYFGAEVHYYAQYRDAVETMLNSLEIIEQ